MKKVFLRNCHIITIMVFVLSALPLYADNASLAAYTQIMNNLITEHRMDYAKWDLTLTQFIEQYQHDPTAREVITTARISLVSALLMQITDVDKQAKALEQCRIIIKDNPDNHRVLESARNYIRQISRNSPNVLTVNERRSFAEELEKEQKQLLSEKNYIKAYDVTEDILSFYDNQNMISCALRAIDLYIDSWISVLCVKDDYLRVIESQPAVKQRLRELFAERQYFSLKYICAYLAVKPNLSKEKLNMLFKVTQALMYSANQNFDPFDPMLQPYWNPEANKPGAANDYILGPGYNILKDEIIRWQQLYATFSTYIPLEISNVIESMDESDAHIAKLRASYAKLLAEKKWNDAYTVSNLLSTIYCGENRVSEALDIWDTTLNELLSETDYNKYSQMQGADRICLRKNIDRVLQQRFIVSHLLISEYLRTTPKLAPQQMLVINWLGNSMKSVVTNEKFPLLTIRIPDEYKNNEKFYISGPGYKLIIAELERWRYLQNQLPVSSPKEITVLLKDYPCQN